MRTLVISQRESIIGVLGEVLTPLNISVTPVSLLTHVDTLLQHSTRFGLPYDIIIVDVFQEIAESLDLIKRIKRQNSNAPIMCLVEADNLIRMQCFLAGADDCINKPLSREELPLRIRAFARRTQDTQGVPEMHPTHGDLTQDSATGHFWVKGKFFALPRKSHKILSLIFKKAGTPVSKESISSLEEEGMTDEAIEGQICRLRKRLDIASSGVVLFTHYGVGYCLKLKVLAVNPMPDTIQPVNIRNSPLASLIISESHSAAVNQIKRRRVKII